MKPCTRCACADPQKRYYSPSTGRWEAQCKPCRQLLEKARDSRATPEQRARRNQVARDSWRRRNGSAEIRAKIGKPSTRYEEKPLTRRSMMRGSHEQV